MTSAWDPAHDPREKLLALQRQVNELDSITHDVRLAALRVYLRPGRDHERNVLVWLARLARRAWRGIYGR